MANFNVNIQSGRLRFAQEPYNLASALNARKGGDVTEEVIQLRNVIDRHMKARPLPTFTPRRGERRWGLPKNYPCRNTLRYHC